MADQPLPRGVAAAMTAFLVGMTAAVMTLRGPARAGVEEKPPTSVVSPARPDEPSLPPLFPRDDMDGAVVFRPSAAARYVDVDRLVLLLVEGESPGGFEAAARKIGVDTKRPGFIKLGAADLEWFTCWFAFDRGKPQNGQPMHTIKFGWPTFRTVRPFDWLAFLRQWKAELVEVRQGRGVFYKVTGMAEMFGDTCIYLPDDRTIAFDDETNIRKRIRGYVPPRPAWLRAADWDKARRGLLAIAVDNSGGQLLKDYDLGNADPEDAIALSLLKGIERGILSLDDTDAMAARAVVTPNSVEAGKATAAIIDGLLGQARAACDRDAAEVKPGDPHEAFVRFCRSFVTRMRVDRSDRSIEVHSEGFGSLRSLVDILGLEIDLSRPKIPPTLPGIDESKIPPQLQGVDD